MRGDSLLEELIESSLIELHNLYLDVWELIVTVHKEEAELLENVIVHSGREELLKEHPGHLDSSLS
jgi:hypothetical protein